MGKIQTHAIKHTGLYRAGAPVAEGDLQLGSGQNAVKHTGAHRSGSLAAEVTCHWEVARML